MTQLSVKKKKITDKTLYEMLSWKPDSFASPSLSQLYLSCNQEFEEQSSYEMSQEISQKLPVRHIRLNRLTINFIFIFTVFQREGEEELVT